MYGLYCLYRTIKAVKEAYDEVYGNVETIKVTGEVVDLKEFEETERRQA